MEPSAKSFTPGLAQSPTARSRGRTPSVSQGRAPGDARRQCALPSSDPCSDMVQPPRTSSASRSWTSPSRSPAPPTGSARRRRGPHARSERREALLRRGLPLPRRRRKTAPPAGPVHFQTRRLHRLHDQIWYLKDRLELLKDLIIVDQATIAPNGNIHNIMDLDLNVLDDRYCALRWLKYNRCNRISGGRAHG